jgi:hypothetical protein
MIGQIEYKRKGGGLWQFKRPTHNTITPYGSLHISYWIIPTFSFGVICAKVWKQSTM